MGGGQGDAPMRGQLNNPGSRALRGETMNRLHLNHLVAEHPDNPPAANRSPGGHSQSAQDFDPHIHLELRRAQEFQPRRQVLKRLGLRGGGEQRQRDDAHGLLRVVQAMTEAHPGRAEDLSVIRYRSDRQTCAVTLGRQPLTRGGPPRVAHELLSERDEPCHFFAPAMAPIDCLTSLDELTRFSGMKGEVVQFPSEVIRVA